MTDPSAVRTRVDFADESGVVRRLRFANPVAIHAASTPRDVPAVIDAADHAARAGRWVVGFVAFEAAVAFDAAFPAREAGRLPLAWFAEFDAPGGPGDADDDAAAGDDGVTSEAALEAEAAGADAAHEAAVRRIHEHIAAGDVYQVNLTVPFVAPSSGAGPALYERMRRAQGGAYSCYLDTGDVVVLSASPELFFERRGTRIRSRPMKGTAARGLHPAADAAVRDALLRSEKERAENVMIVDVVRNDLGRIADVGSVHVTALCAAERYPSVWQMTSTVEADVPRSTALVEIFRALFPPASVTGAPKIRATAIIHELEPAPRGVYCGAIGLLRPGGDATFNVAIRTAWAVRAEAALHLHAGGGITADSTPTGELAELRAKLRAFTRSPARPDLFETIRVEHGRLVRLERHLARMQASADYFDIPFDEAKARAALHVATVRHAAVPVARARLDLSSRGVFAATVRPHDDAHGETTQRVALAHAAVDRFDVRLYHKCADRSMYDAALAAERAAFDVLLWNQDGHATELTRGNLVVELDGRRLTPPVDCGLLAGTLRAELVENGAIAERTLTLAEVRRAARLWFINALRGWVPIALTDRPPERLDR